MYPNIRIENLENLIADNVNKWSAFRSQDYGYMRFVAHNRTHIHLEQVSVDLEGEVIDSMWLVKDKPSFNLP